MDADQQAEEILRCERERNAQLEFRSRRKRQLVALPFFAAIMIVFTYLMANIGMYLFASINALLVVYIFIRVAVMFRMAPTAYLVATKPQPTKTSWYWLVELAGLALYIIAVLIAGRWHDT